MYKNKIFVFLFTFKILFFVQDFCQGTFLSSGFPRAFSSVGLEGISVPKNDALTQNSNVANFAPPLKNDFSSIVGRSLNSAGQLFTFSNNFNYLEPYKTPIQQASSGTAFFIDETGLMITNAHCVNQAEVMYLQIPHFGKHRFGVEVVAVSPDRDLALIQLTEESRERIENALGCIPYLEFGDSDAVKRAEEIVAIGFPLGQEWIKTTTGVVSGIQTLGIHSFIQISAPINPGNSGGPALNSRGYVVGVNSCGIFDKGTQNVGYIIPSNEVLVFIDHARQVVKDSVKKSDRLVRCPLLGIQYHGSPEALVSFKDNPHPGGAYVCKVLKNSFADTYGIQEGDMIYEVNGHVVDRFGDLEVPWSKDKVSIAMFTGKLEINDDLTFIVYRNGTRVEIKGMWKPFEPFPVRLMHQKYEDIDYLTVAGIVLMPLTINHVQLLHQINEDLVAYIKPDKQVDPAVVISHILPHSTAESARFLHPGMIVTEVNGIAVSTVEECRLALRNSINTGYVAIYTARGEFFVARLNKVISDEKRLSKTYLYPIDSVINEIENELSDSSEKF